MTAKVIDLSEVRAVLIELDALALSDPDLFEGLTEEDWMRIMGEQETRAKAKAKNQIGVRLPVELIERVDAYADRLSGELPGATFNRTDAIRILLMQALEANSVQKDESR